MAKSERSAAVDRYVELKSEIAALEKELDELKDEVYSAVDSAGGEVADEKFTLKSQKRPKYKFSDDYEQKDKDLKELRKTEIKDGVATIEGYSEFVTFRLKK